MELTGETSILRNALAGAVFVETESAVVDGGEIREVTTVPGTWGLDGVYRVGDGVQVIRPQGPVTIRNIMLSASDRVGLLLSVVNDEWDDVRLEGIEVNGDGEALGAIAQGSGVPADWDRGVTRLGDTVENDAAFEGTLPTVRFAENAVPLIDDSIAFIQSFE